MNKGTIKHKIVKKKHSGWTLFCIALFSLVLAFGLWFFDIISQDDKLSGYIMKTLIIGLYTYMVTRQENRKLFEPLETEEIVHEVE